MDDRHKTRINAVDSAHLSRLDWFYVCPHFSIVAVLFQFINFRDGFDPFINYKTFYGLIRCVLGIIQFDHILKGITYGTSTAYGRRFCFRRAALLVSGMLLAIRASCLDSGFGFVKSSLGKAFITLDFLQYSLVLVALPFQISQGYATKGKC